jgi:ribosomal protein S12 methylthiotransferase
MSKTKRNINYSVLTLGCSKNAVDSEALISQMNANNYRFTPEIRNSELLIINTCGFIKPAKEESTQVILEACELKRRGKIKKLLVAGCLAERYQDELRRQIPEVDSFFGVSSSKEIISYLDGIYKKELIGESRALTPPHFSYIKIAEGCDRPCSFCAIPLIRGKHVSRPDEEILKETVALYKNGTLEFNIIAQDTTYYGLDIYGKRTIADLLQKMSDLVPDSWIRLMYAFPTGFPEDLAEVIAQRNNICSYLDIPLQHISDKVLTSMKRGTNGKDIRKLLDRMKAKIPDLAIRSTFITGYPNESEEDFNELLDFIKEYELDRVGIFTYSQEEGTSAFPLGDPIPESIKQERRNTLMEAQMSISLRKNQEKVGKNFKVLIDDYSEGLYYGRTVHDAPEVDNNVIFSSKEHLKVGTFTYVKITEAKEYDLIGEIR